MRNNNGTGDIGSGKKRMTSCNWMYRGSKFALVRKDADLSQVFYCMNGGKLMNVRYSTTLSGEKLTDIRHSLQWDFIDWKKVEWNVNKLQTRIAKAVRQRKWHLIKRLQYLLTKSFHARLLAVKKVTQNRGKKTAGIDGEKWTTPLSRTKAALSLSCKNYKAKPMRRIYIEKYGKKEKRPLSIPTMHDRAMQALHALALDPIAETNADRASFGFRQNRSAHDACELLFSCLCRKQSAHWVLEGDIKGCFDNINHDWLLTNIPMDKSILKQFLKAGFIYHRHLNPTKVGTPQGGIISPILANMTLDGIENTIAAKYHTTKTGIVAKSRHNPHKVNFVRYADDFVVTADSEEVAKDIAKLISAFLKKKGLELSTEKTLVSHIDEGFDFLGWNFRKYKEKLIIKPSKKSIEKITTNISDVIKNGKAWSQESLIRKLKPIISGWTGYHQSVVSKDTFSKLDYKLWNMLWSWAKRRHPHKSHRWIANRYWHHVGSRKWVFSVNDYKLRRFSDTKIIRHPCVKLDMNHYLDREYFKWRRSYLKTRKNGNYTNKPNYSGLTGTWKKIVSQMY
ncbi:group II intron reverse transcriptase/maturase [Methanolobus sp. ZRKC5]|uniref:group II intron reverse transcriptase/maturase n=2 Tax=unclassified Methanolobus TaxID=2629569 RepID=UPI00313DCE35